MSLAVDVDYHWRAEVSDDEMVELVAAHGGNPRAGWWEAVQSHSLGWVTARSRAGELVGFVNVAWDGGDHAFLLDTKTHGAWQRRGVATELVRIAAQQAASAGCEWLHVDFEERLGSFYFGACGFQPTAAGLIRLRPAR